MHGDHMEKHAKIMQDDMISKLKIKVWHSPVSYEKSFNLKLLGKKVYYKA